MQATKPAKSGLCHVWAALVRYTTGSPSNNPSAPMSTSTRTTLGELVRHVLTLAAGESGSVHLDSTTALGVSVTVGLAAGDAATAHGSLDDAPVVASGQAFPLIGEAGAIASAPAAHTVCIAYPGPLRTVIVSAAGGNSGVVRVVVLQ